MRNRRTQFGIVFTLITLLLVTVTGCKKKTEPAPAEETKEALSVTIEQTTCPVMGGAINKDLFTEYKGKKVYFCCPGCKEKFEEAPEQYLAKLPQFKQ